MFINQVGCIDFFLAEVVLDAIQEYLSIEYASSHLHKVRESTSNRVELVNHFNGCSKLHAIAEADEDGYRNGSIEIREDVQKYLHEELPRLDLLFLDELISPNLADVLFEPVLQAVKLHCANIFKRFLYHAISFLPELSPFALVQVQKVVVVGVDLVANDQDNQADGIGRSYNHVEAVGGVGEPEGLHDPLDERVAEGEQHVGGRAHGHYLPDFVVLGKRGYHAHLFVDGHGHEYFLGEMTRLQIITVVVAVDKVLDHH